MSEDQYDLPGPPAVDAPAVGSGFLQVVYADGQRHRLPLRPGPLVVGRADEADVRLDDPSVSRRHAELAPGAGGWTVRDLGSRNRTRVNGRPVGGGRTPVGPADRIEVGAVVLSIERPAALVRAAVAAADGSGSGTRPVRGPAELWLRPDPGTAVVGLAELEPPAVAARHLTTLLDLGQSLLATPDSARRLRALCRHMAEPAYGARYAAVLRVRADRPDAALPLCEAGSDLASAGGPYVSRTVLRAAAGRGEAVLAGNRPGGGGHADLEVSISSAVLPVAVIACPLSPAGAAAAGAEPGAVDLLYVVLPPAYATAEWLALAGLAARQHQQAEATWAARQQAERQAGFERELDRAREIQRRLLPRVELPAAGQTGTPGVDAAVGFDPCYAVGGDYVDVVPVGDRILLAVADVCGKGLPAALVTVAVHAVVRAGAAAGLGLDALTANLNRHLCASLPDDSFVTLFAAVLDPATGRLECANAGHPPPFVVPADGGPPRPLDVEPNLPLGLDPDPVACEVRTLGPGDGLALYTDGLSELAGPDGQMLRIAGVGRLVAAAWPSAAVPARAAADELTRLLDAAQAGGPPTDDRTFLLVRRT